MTSEGSGNRAGERPRAPLWLRVELATMLGAGVLGGILSAFGGTLGRMSIFLLGWAVGCAAHIGLLVGQSLITRRYGDPR